MNARARSNRARNVRPALVSLEERTLLNAAMPHDMHEVGARVAAEVHHVKLDHRQVKLTGPTIHVIDKVDSGGYQFLDFDGPDAGTNAAAGTNQNGISNAGVSVGFAIDNAGVLHNFTVNPLKTTSATVLNINNSTNAMALAVNSEGTVVGTDGNGNAFYENHGNVTTFIPLGGTAAVALGINDRGLIVGQYTTSSGTMPGFVRLNANNYITINAPDAATGTNIVNVQGINNKGQVIGFYEGTDGNVHGFTADIKGLKGGSTITGTPITDPTIPNVPGEPGATFVFSQLLGINDKGLVVGYYGDSTLSQHGFFYNTHTGVYTFLDDPDEAFDNGVEVTQITGITDSNEITGFYSDANGVAHGFVATPDKP
jgi:uncharacterized membrane protein